MFEFTYRGSQAENTFRPRRRSSIQELIQHTHDSLDVWAAGITIVIGGQFFSWNTGLEAGTMSYGLAILFMGAAYLCLVLSMAELTSMLPFAGGGYGLARCALGFYFGFIVGCFEIVSYIMYVSCSMIQLSNMIMKLESNAYSLCIWIVAYVLGGTCVFIGGKVFWFLNKFIALLSLLTIGVYCIIAIGYGNIYQHAGGQEYMIVGGLNGFIKVLPLASWLYVGVETLNMLTADIMNPKQVIPKGQISSMLTLIITSWCIFLSSISFPPSMPWIASELAPFSSGFSIAFNITMNTATAISIPATFATAQGLMMAFTNVISALGSCKLLPPFVARRNKTFNTPLNALLFGSVVSFGLCFVDALVENLDRILFNVSMLFAFITYIAQCYGYIYFKRRHQQLIRRFDSPLGIPGAVFGMIVWCTSVISLIFFQDDSYSDVVIATSVFGIFTLYYFVYAKSRQTFSDDEKSILLFAHVANLNHAGPRLFGRSIVIAPQSPVTELFGKIRPQPKPVESPWNLTSAHTTPHQGKTSHHRESSIIQKTPPKQDNLFGRLKDPSLCY